MTLTRAFGAFRMACLSVAVLATLSFAAGAAESLSPPAPSGSMEAWKRHREATLKDPSVLRFYGFEGLQAGAASILNAAHAEGALAYRVEPMPGAPAEAFEPAAGRWPGKQAIRLDRGYLTGKAPPVDANGFTAEAWIRVLGPGSLRGNSGAQNGTLLSAGDGYWSGWRVTLAFPSRKLTLEIGRPQPSHSIAISGGSLDDEAWHHLAATWNGREMRLFVDGNLTAWGPFTGLYTPPASGTFRVGYANAGVGSVRMEVDEVGFHQRALAPDEILALANFHLSLPPGLAARFRAATVQRLATNAVASQRELQGVIDTPNADREWVALARLQLAANLRDQRQLSSAAAQLVVIMETGGLPQPLGKAAAAELLRVFKESPGSVTSPAVLRDLLARPELSAAERQSARLALGHARFAARDFAAARAEYAQLAATADAPAYLRSIARLRVAECLALERNPDAAKTEYARVSQIPGVPDHHRWEAEERIKELNRTQAGLAPRDPSASRTLIPPSPPPGLRLYVAPGGADTNPGTADKPFATLDRARDEIRTLKKRDALPKGGVAVLVRGGDYKVDHTLKLNAADSGAEAAQIVYRAADGESPRFTGGIRVAGFRPVRDATILARLPEEARGKVYQTDLRAYGVTNLRPLILGGFASGNGFRSHPVIELFCDGKAMPMARWPNEGMVRAGDISAPDGHQIHGLTGSKTGRFRYEGDRPSRWKEEKAPMLYGYWFWDWADSYERITSIDTDKREITLATPYHTYGYRKGARYCAVNMLCEIDRPGEWYLDRSSGLLYFYPPSDLAEAVVELSLFDAPMMTLEDVSQVRFEGLTWDLGSTDAILLRGGSRCLFAGCTVRRCGGNGIEIQGGDHHGLLSCDISSMGRGGTVFAGGDRRTLRPGGHFLENCHIYDLSRVDHTYTPAVLMSGVGNRIAHNLMHHVNSSAIRLEGNDHLVEFNEIHDVLLESDDQGGADMFGNPTYRGNIYRYNYWHHIGNWRAAAEDLPCGQAGIRLDDAICGVLIYGNIFYRSSAGGLGFGGVQIHGGKENWLDNNIFADCRSAVSFSPWGEKRWKEFTAPAMKSKEIDPALYQQRYPALARLAEDADMNYLCRNLAWNCGRLLYRERGVAKLADNYQSSEDPGFVDAAHGNFALKPGAPVWGRLSLQPIPFEEVGLYPDAHRRNLPLEAIRDARAQ